MIVFNFECFREIWILVVNLIFMSLVYCYLEKKVIVNGGIICGLRECLKLLGRVFVGDRDFV